MNGLRGGSVRPMNLGAGHEQLFFAKLNSPEPLRYARNESGEDERFREV